MKATCKSTLLMTTLQTIVEDTNFGPFTKIVEIKVTRKDWANYPGQKNFSNFAVDTFWNGRLVEGHITNKMPQLVK